jgi:hypothetical protein
MTRLSVQQFQLKDLGWRDKMLARVKTSLENHFYPDAVDLDTAEVSTLQHQNLAGSTGEILRLTLNGREGRKEKSIVLKRVTLGQTGNPRWQASGNSSSAFYWAREVDNYRSYFLQSHDSIRAAECYGIIQEENDVILLLEDLRGRPGTSFSVSELAQAARDLGRWQRHHWETGRFAKRLPIFLSEYVNRRTAWFECIDELADASELGISRAERSKIAAKVLDVYKHRGAFLKFLGSQPQTFCHNDFWPPNIFSEEEPLIQTSSGSRTVLIDFAYSCQGALGDDPANLVLDSIADRFVDVERAEDLWSQTSEAFVAAACQGEKQLAVEVQNTIYVSAALKYSWLLPAAFEWSASEEKREELDTESGGADRFFEVRWDVIRFHSELVSKALKILSV